MSAIHDMINDYEWHVVVNSEHRRLLSIANKIKWNHETLQMSSKTIGKKQTYNLTTYNWGRKHDETILDFLQSVTGNGSVFVFEWTKKRELTV